MMFMYEICWLQQDGLVSIHSIACVFAVQVSRVLSPRIFAPVSCPMIMLVYFETFCTIYVCTTLFYVHPLSNLRYCADRCTAPLTAIYLRPSQARRTTAR